MKKLLLKIFFVFSFLLVPLLYEKLKAQVPDWAWAKQIGGINHENSTSIAIDNYGNVYTAGAFVGTVDFDPGSGIFSITSLGLSDGFISKLDNSGNFIWAKSFGGLNGNLYANSIAIDQTGNGDIYVTGQFAGIVDFDPSPSIYNLTAVGNNDIFILKLNNTGDLLWVKSIGGINNDVGMSLVLDTSQNKHLYVTGTFADTVDFDPGPGVFNLISSPYASTFITKLDSSGNLIWAKAFTGTIGCKSYSIAIDESEDVYTTGWFEGIIDFDPDVSTYNLSSAGVSDIFISQIDSSGHFVYAKQIGWIGNEQGNSISIDKLGNVYTTGFFGLTVDFDPGPGVFYLGSGGPEIFILKLDKLGNFVWAKSFTGGVGTGYSIVLDTTNNCDVYTTGWFGGTVDFDPGTGISTLSSNTNDIFVSKLDSSGNFIWAKSAQGTNNDGAHSIALDITGNVFITGWFNSSSLSFGAINLIGSDSSQITYDVFIAKIDAALGIEKNVIGNNFFSVYPNPAKDVLTIQTVSNQNENLYIELFDITGRKLQTVFNGKSTTGVSNHSLSVKGFSKGVYVLKVNNSARRIIVE